jgi:acyl-CoA dehydrogenase
MEVILWLLGFLILFLILAYRNTPLKVWSVIALVALFVATIFSSLPALLLFVFWLIILAIVVPLNVISWRYRWVTQPILKLYRKLQPVLSVAEQEALAAGTVDWEKELFSGKPDWDKLINYPIDALSPEEQTFLDGPVEQLCQMIDDWDITHRRADLPPCMWTFLKKHGFFGLIIPKEYGGKAFSALLHSAVLTKLAGHSVTVSTTVMVPNSLGPAELLLHYGTENQRNYYLPRLACGQEIPCFALTGPLAGSDASAIPDTGIVCKGMFADEEIIGIKLNWDKRYITLAPVATLIGLAFKLYDPQHLLGEKENIGITLALLPTSLPGITIGRRHYPLNMAFQNGPIQGKNVFIPLDFIIGGASKVGQGWQMLMECLAAGRGLSLPSAAVGSAKFLTAATSAYARIRKQFNLPIGRFEGVEEALERIAGYTYIMEAVRKFTVSMIDRKQKPVIASAIAKYTTTEMGRQLSNLAMDIHGGKGICLGPRNYIARAFQSVPIGITVEGANILTRTLIIFGQSAIRCHPYLLAEMMAASEADPDKALIAFDQAIVAHLGFMANNFARTFLLGLSGGRFTYAPARSTQRYYQQLTRFSAAFVFLTDLSLVALGAEIKRRERLSGRLADILSLLYQGCAVLRKFEEEGNPSDDLPLVQWCCESILYQLQQTIDAFLRNFPFRGRACLAKWIIFPLGQRYELPGDALGQQVAKLLMHPTTTRSRLIDGAYLIPDPHNRVGLMEQLFIKIAECEPLEKRLAQAIKSGVIVAPDFEQQLSLAIQNKVLNPSEAERLLWIYKETLEVIAVDDFAPSELGQGGNVSPE